MSEEKRNEALEAENEYRTTVEEAYDYVENFDILETITNVGNDEVFTPRKTADMMLDSLPEEVWHNPSYRWLNPATKNGIFEREIAIRLDRGLAEAIPDIETRRKHILQNMIFSIGQTKFTANVARRTVYYCSQANRACDGIKAPDGHYVNGYAIGNGTWFDDEEGNIKTPCANHDFVDAAGRSMPTNCNGDSKKKYHCKYCGISGDSKYNDANQRENYAYELIHVNHLVLTRYSQQRFFGGEKMKFDIIIGNPPYQLSDGGGNGTSAMPIYHLFIEQAMALKPRYLSMIIPSRWFSGGKGLDEFRESFLANRHIKKLVDFVNAKDCFPSSSISGGVCYFLYDSEYEGDCEFTSIRDGSKSTAIRKLNQYPIFVRYNDAISIIDKIKSVEKETVVKYVSARNVFGIQSTFKGHEKDNEHSYLVLTSSGERYASLAEITQGRASLGNYKVIISKLTSEHANEPTKDGTFTVISTIRLLRPQEACTDSYLLLFESDSETKAKNYITYLRTKFYRFLLLQAVSSVNLSRDKWQFIPEVDFNESWTDEKLFEKFGLTADEAAYITSLMKEKN